MVRYVEQPTAVVGKSFLSTTMYKVSIGSLYWRRSKSFTASSAIATGQVQKQVHRNFYGKAEVRVRSEGMRSTCLLSASAVALVLWLFACGNAWAQTTGTALSCTKDVECPSGQRCGFTSGCKSKGKCVVPSHDAHCIDPGGRCGCDGRPVDIFCAVGSRTEYTSAPTDAVGPCPRPCTRELSCGKTGLVCRNGVC